MVPKDDDMRRYTSERLAKRYELEQRSAAEVPGFHARTVIDDTIGKLYTIRQRMVVPLPPSAPALLDDVEEQVEELLELLYDAEEVVDLANVPPELLASRSVALSPCSCGGVYDISLPPTSKDDGSDT